MPAKNIAVAEPLVDGASGPINSAQSTHINRDKKTKKVTQTVEKKSRRKALKVLAQLSAEEQRAIRECTAAVQYKERELRIMKAGMNSVWQEIVGDYDLPEFFDYDYATGIVKEKIDG